MSHLMATLEVRIKYETIIGRACYWTLLSLSPVLALLSITVLFYNFPDNGLGVFPLLIICLYLFSIFRDNRLVLTQQGICFPRLSTFTRNCPWYKLKSVKMIVLSTQVDNYRSYELVLHYSGSDVKLALRNFSPNDVEQLLLGLETFAGSVNGLESILELKKLVKAELKIEGIKSYTNLWDDELRYRYAATTFIPLNPGSTLQDGQIKVLRQLGFGGLSAIYLVQCHNKELAILKESVLPAGVDDELRAKAEEQFAREAKILAGLEHPQIAKVLDHFVERGHYLLLEYIHGQDLRQYVNEHGRLAESMVLAFAWQIAEILRYLHAREPAIIHRDLTPENLIVTDKGNIKLIDFGAANEFLHTATGTLVGKHAYMAPEQLKGKACTQSDLYSLGATMQFLLTASDPTPLAPSHPADLNSSVSAETDALVYQLTQFDAESRCQTALELVAKLKSLMQGIS